MCNTEALRNFTNLQESICDWVHFKWYCKHPCSKPSILQLYFKGHHHRWFSVNIFVKTFFHCFISRKHTFIDVLQDILENSAKFTGNRLYQTLLTPAHMFFWGFFKIFWNTSERMLLISITSLYCFYFRTYQYLFNIPSYFGVVQNSWPPAHWAAIFFLHIINAIEIKIAPVLKTFMVFIS